MFNKLRKHSVKIFVFIINILLAAIAVFIIQEKDQARLLEKMQEEKKNLESENTESDPPSSFESSVSIEEQESASSLENSLEQTNPSTQNLPASNETVVPVNPPPENPIPANTNSTPTTKTKPSNAKTKTS